MATSPSRIREKIGAYAAVWRGQTAALFRKNYILARRNTSATAIQLSVPFLFCVVLLLLQIANDNNPRRAARTAVVLRPEDTAVGPIPRCYVPPEQTTDRGCITFAYVPNDNPAVVAIMERIRARNNIPVGEVKGFRTQAELDNYIILRKNRTQGAYNVEITPPREGPTASFWGNLPECATTTDYSGCEVDAFAATGVSGAAVFGGGGGGAANRTKSPLRVEYSVQFNKTDLFSRGRAIKSEVYVMLPMQVAFDQAATEHFAKAGADADPLELDFSYASFPHTELAAVDLIGRTGPTFFFGALMFNLVLQAGQLVAEREGGLRQSLTTIGLGDMAFWTSWLGFNSLFNLLSALVLVLSGLVLRFDFFVKNAFGTYFILFSLFGLAMVSLAMFISVWLSRAATATSMGFAVFLCGTIVMAFARLIFAEDVGFIYVFLFTLFPPSLMAKGLADLGAASDNELETGMTMQQLGELECNLKPGNLEGVYTLCYCYWWLVFDFFIWFALALYFDQVLPDAMGCRRRKPLFFLDPAAALVRRWTGKGGGGGAKGAVTRPVDGAGAPVVAEEDGGRDGGDESDDVAREARLVNDKVPAVREAAMVVDGLSKTFAKFRLGCLPDPNGYFTAVVSVSYFVRHNSLFCLLGHNGAGKSTTFNMVTGQLPLSGGAATVCGLDVATQLDEVRRVIGVCPQHDCLWGALTGREHLELFSRLKGRDPEGARAEAVERLRDVDLTAAGDVPSGAYSGGMRRRLSVALAMVGDPKLVFLDEPTTGMDPVSRRKVWEMIQRTKKGRAVVLTTHSMEEADTLGDKVAIMKHGRISVIGTTLDLKRKFGAGYRVSVVLRTRDEAQGSGGEGGGGGGATVSREETCAWIRANFAEAEFPEDAPEGAPPAAAADGEAKDGAGPAKDDGAAEAHATNTTNTAAVAAAAADQIGGGENSRGARVLGFTVPRGAEDALAAFCRRVEAGEAPGVADVQLSLTTMEEVFIRVAAAAEAAHDLRQEAKQARREARARLWYAFWAGLGMTLLFYMMCSLSGRSITKDKDKRAQEALDKRLGVVGAEEKASNEGAVAIVLLLVQLVIFWYWERKMRRLRNEGTVRVAEASAKARAADQMARGGGGGKDTARSEPSTAEDSNKGETEGKGGKKKKAWRLPRRLYIATVVIAGLLALMSAGTVMRGVFKKVPDPPAATARRPDEPATLWIPTLSLRERLRRRLGEGEGYVLDDAGGYPWGGPIAGDVDATSAVLALRVGARLRALLPAGPPRDPPAVHLARYDDASKAWVDETADVTFASAAAAADGGAPFLPANSTRDGFFRVLVSGLKGDALYSAVMSVDVGGGVSNRSAPTRFRTAGGNRVVTFGATSCLGEADRPWPSLKVAAERRLDFMALLGDTVYADRDCTEADYRRTWHRALADGETGLAALAASTSLVATWDDHEVYNDWAGFNGTASRMRAAKDAFREALPTRDFSGDRLYRKFAWGDVLEIFVLDARAERSCAEGQERKYLSDAQEQWLGDSLKASTATFKIILNSVPITRMAAFQGALSGAAAAAAGGSAGGASGLDDIVAMVAGADRWEGFAKQRERVLKRIWDDKVEGVLWVSGDFHFGQVATVEPPPPRDDDASDLLAGLAGGAAGRRRRRLADDADKPHPPWFNATEVLAGPAGSGINSFLQIGGAVSLVSNLPQHKIVVDTWTYTEFECDAPRKRINVKFLDDFGATVDEVMLGEYELGFTRGKWECTWCDGKDPDA